MSFDKCFFSFLVLALVSATSTAPLRGQQTTATTAVTPSTQAAAGPKSAAKTAAPPLLTCCWFPASPSRDPCASAAPDPAYYAHPWQHVQAQPDAGAAFV